jgi:hypothetical protein
MYKKALYYPSIDIENESWLKTSLLYWDELATIVPSSIDNPYENQSSSILHKEGFLKPVRVRPTVRAVEEASRDILKYIESPEAMRIIQMGGTKDSMINRDKLGYMLKEKLGFNDYDHGRIHSEKMGHLLHQELKHANTESDWVNIDSGFANFYMTLLAEKISSEEGMALLTNFSAYEQLTLRIKRGEEHPREDNYRFRRGRDIGNIESYTDAMLAQIVIQNLSLKSDLRIDHILEFREKHKNELAAFRGALQDLTDSISDGDVTTLKGLRERLDSVYCNSVNPSIEELRAKLTENKIVTALSDFSISGMSSIIGVASAASAFPVIGNYAILAGAGISATAMTVAYKGSRKSLKANPFSYVLSLESQFG